MHGTVVGRSTGRWPGQCLAFVVGGQPYAVPILVVQEIRRYSEPTVLPGVPPHVLGVINLRGTVVPVFDLRLRFGLGTAVFDRLTVTIIVVVGGRYVGIVADEVSKVMAPEVSAYREGPELASTFRSFTVSCKMELRSSRCLTWRSCFCRSLVPSNDPCARARCGQLGPGAAVHHRAPRAYRRPRGGGHGP